GIGAECSAHAPHATRPPLRCQEKKVPDTFSSPPAYAAALLHSGNSCTAYLEDLIPLSGIPLWSQSTSLSSVISGSTHHLRFVVHNDSVSGAPKLSLTVDEATPFSDVPDNTVYQLTGAGSVGVRAKTSSGLTAFDNFV